MKIDYGFSYIVHITIESKTISMIIRNQKKVPIQIIEEMAKQRINKYINDVYHKSNYYLKQTSEQFFERMIKQANFEIQDLNDVEVYDLNVTFDKNEKIVNNIHENKFNTKIVESSINKISNEVA